MDGAVFAVNPHNGDLQWQVPFKADYSIAVATPRLGARTTCCSSRPNTTAARRSSSCSATAMQTKATELWSSNRLRLHHGNAMRIGDAIYFSSGGKGSQAILSAVDARSGKIHWQERSIEKATFVWADQKLITLDQDGNLMIAHPSPQGFKIAAKAPLLTQPVVDAARAGRHAAVHPRPPDHDGRRPRVDACDDGHDHDDAGGGTERSCRPGDQSRRHGGPLRHPVRPHHRLAAGAGLDARPRARSRRGRADARRHASTRCACTPTPAASRSGAARWAGSRSRPSPPLAWSARPRSPARCSFSAGAHPERRSC